MAKVLIVGGVAGGATAASRLRRLDENAEIILFERDEYIAFANCGLPYYIGGEISDKDELILQTPESFNARYNIDVRIFNEVTGIDRNAKTVSVKNHKTGETYTESYDKLILSPGAEPVRPDIQGIDSDKVFSLRNIPDMSKIKEYIDTRKPSRAVVIGGGFIGMEMVENLCAAGLEVTLVEMQEQVLAPLDFDMSCGVHRYIESKGVSLILSTGIKAIVDHDDSLTITLNEIETESQRESEVQGETKDQGESQTKGESKAEGTSESKLQTDMIIIAVGVRPESKLAKSAGIKANERGFIIVDDYMRSSDPNIYSVGDVVEITNFVTGERGSIALAGPANKQGRIAANNLCGLESKYNGTQGSSIIKIFDMTVAVTGVNEKTAKRLGLNYDKSFTSSVSHAGYYPGAVSMSIKTLFDKGSGKILGVQIVGYEGVDKRCDVFATAIHAEMTAYDLTKLELCYAPPYSSVKDPVNIAGFVIENLLKREVEHFHWHDVKGLPQDGSVTLLDVRTRTEYKNGTIAGFINIPVDELRGRLSELDKSKPVYITCHSGLRGYTAAGILNQNGYNAHNLSGGFALYESIFGKHTEHTALSHKSAAAAHLHSLDTKISMHNMQDSVHGEQNSDHASQKGNVMSSGHVIKVNAAGLQCPGPILKLSAALREANPGDTIEISASDPAFEPDVEAFCSRTNNELVSIGSDKGILTAVVVKSGESDGVGESSDSSVGNLSGGKLPSGNGKNIIVFSGDLDKTIASFIIANASAALGRKTSMFFTFWGLNILRKPRKVKVRKTFISRMFGIMMPRGTPKLGLSKMNMLGIGPRMIRFVMRKKNVYSLEYLLQQAVDNGVELVACSMSMGIMGITEEELLDGVKFGGATAMLAHAEESDMSLFI